MTTALDPAAYRAAVGHFATGVAVVTTAGPNGPSGLTANAICSLSLDPVLMIVCLDQGSRTLAAVRDSGRLAVNVLARDQERIARRFATKDDEAAKWADVAYHEEDGLPVLDGTVAWLLGRVRDFDPGGDHVIAVTEVESAAAAGGEPLLFYRSAYRSLGEAAGAATGEG